MFKAKSLEEISIEYDNQTYVAIAESSYAGANASTLISSYLSIRERRHNIIVWVIKDTLGYTDISNDKLSTVFKGYKGTGFDQSPDLYKENKNSISIIEVTVSNNYLRAKNNKVNKYFPIIDPLSVFKKKKVDLSTVCITPDGSNLVDLYNLSISEKVVNYIGQEVLRLTKTMEKIKNKIIQLDEMEMFNLMTNKKKIKKDEQSVENIRSIMRRYFNDLVQPFSETVENKHYNIDFKVLASEIDTICKEDTKFDHFGELVLRKRITESKVELAEMMNRRAKEATYPMLDKTFLVPFFNRGSYFEDKYLPPDFDKETAMAIGVLDKISGYQFLSSEDSYVIDKLKMIRESCNPIVTQGGVSFKQFKWGEDYDFVLEYNRNMFVLKGEEKNKYRSDNVNRVKEATKAMHDRMKSIRNFKNVYHIGRHHVTVGKWSNTELKSMGIGKKKDRKQLESEKRCMPDKVYSIDEDTTCIEEIMSYLLEIVGREDMTSIINAGNNLNSVFIDIIKTISKNKKIPRFQIMDCLENLSRLMTALKYTCSYSTDNKSLSYGTAGIPGLVYVVGPGVGGFKVNMSKPIKIFFMSKYKTVLSCSPISSSGKIDDDYVWSTKWIRLPMSVIDTLSNSSSMITPLIKYKLMSTEDTKKEMKDVAVQTMILCSSKKSMSVMLADFRYIFTSCIAYASSIADLIKDKMYVALKTKLSVYLWRKMFDKLELFHDYATTKMVYVKSDKLGEKTESKYLMPKIFTEGNSYSLSDTLNELYYSHLIEKDSRNAMHDQVKGTENALKHLLLYDQALEGMPYAFTTNGYENKMTELKQIIYSTNVGYSEKYVRASADALFMELGLTEDLKDSIIDKSGIFNSITVLNNMNNCMNELFGREKSTMMVLQYSLDNIEKVTKVSKIVEDFKSGKLVINEYVDMLINTNLSIINEAVKLISEQDLLLKFGISRKVQVGDFREIYVMELKTRIMQKFIESYIMALCTLIDSEYISKNSDTRPLKVEGLIRDVSTSADKADKIVVYENADCSKWAPSSTCQEFIAFIEQSSVYLHSGMCGFIVQFFKKMLFKKLQLPHTVVQKFNEYKSYMGPLCEKHSLLESVIDYPASFMMGIFNYFSSLKHVAKSSLHRKLLTISLDDNIGYHDLEHSDDSFKIHTAERMSSIRNSVHRERITAKLVNIKYNSKKTNFSYYLSEFLSVYYYNRSLSVPYIKFIRSIRDNLNFKSYAEDYYNINARASEAAKKGAPYLLALFMMFEGHNMLDRYYGLNNSDLTRYSEMPEVFGRPLVNPLLVSLYGSLSVALHVPEDEVSKAEHVLGLITEEDVEDIESFLYTKTVIKSIKFVDPRKVRMPKKLPEYKEVFYKDNQIKTITHNIISLDLSAVVSSLYKKDALVALTKSVNNNSFLNAAYFSTNDCILTAELTQEFKDKEVLTIDQFMKIYHEDVKYEIKESMTYKLIKKCIPDMWALSKTIGEMSLVSISNNHKLTTKLYNLTLATTEIMPKDDIRKAIMYSSDKITMQCFYPTLNINRLEITLHRLKKNYEKDDISIPFNVYSIFKFTRPRIIALLPISNYKNVTSMYLNTIMYCTMTKKKMIVTMPSKTNKKDETELQNYYNSLDEAKAFMKVTKIMSKFEDQKSLKETINKIKVSNLTGLNYLATLDHTNTLYPSDYMADLNILKKVCGLDYKLDMITKGCGFYIDVVKAQEKVDGKYTGSGEFILCFRDRIKAWIETINENVIVYLSNLETNTTMQSMMTVVKEYFNVMWTNKPLLKKDEDKLNKVGVFCDSGVSSTMRIDFNRYLLKTKCFAVLDPNYYISRISSMENKSNKFFSPISEINDLGMVYDTKGNLIHSFCKGYKFNITNFDITYTTNDNEKLDIGMIKMLLSGEPLKLFDEVYTGLSEKEYKEIYKYISERTGFTLKSAMERAISKTEFKFESKLQDTVKLFGNQEEMELLEDKSNEDEEDDDMLNALLEDDFMLEQTEVLNESDAESEEDIQAIMDMTYGLVDNYGRRIEVNRNANFITNRSNFMASRYKDLKLDLYLSAYKGTTGECNFKIDSMTRNKIVNYNTMLKYGDFGNYEILMYYLFILHLSTTPKLSAPGAITSLTAFQRIETFITKNDNDLDDLIPEMPDD